ncbi:MBL fold metallo-hydrolase [Streptomyces sp. WAC06614]|uniref:MBL fold metallo-hydrolase n=1 Tax=Streptomyces sp. WAC06614 TaxID=2487416 RepID=UPI000F769627|nr:MBL fold metallo-hydrolase [Streptomyces sp. WAC06614]RSS68878.1 MBL fold metallo-hydrolase [Streptomyces sp. WAC06614]
MATATPWNTPARTPRSLVLGEHKVTWLPDGHVQLDPRRWLPGTTDADWAGENAALLDPEGYLAASIGALLIEYRGRAMLVDAGFGPHDIPAAHTHPTLGVLVGGGLPEALRSTGVDPAAVELIAFSHLHDDHFGWAFRPGQGARTPFSSAVFAASAAEWAGWPQQPDGDGRLRAVADGEEIFPGVTARSTPGHTAGHTSYVLDAADGQRLIAFGDVFHSPAQFARPDWPVAMDALPEQGVASRRALLDELAGPGTLAFANHFADVVFGRLDTASGTARWEPLVEIHK